jgi:hypothetical protein
VTVVDFYREPGGPAHIAIRHLGIARNPVAGCGVRLDGLVHLASGSNDPAAKPGFWDTMCPTCRHMFDRLDPEVDS